jgi:hypothetical protein
MASIAKLKGRDDRGPGKAVIARSEATKQSILPLRGLPLRGAMDCFASLVMTL